MVAVLASYASRFSVRAHDVTVDATLLWVGAGLAIAAAVLLAYVPRLPSADAANGMGLAGGALMVLVPTWEGQIAGRRLIRLCQNRAVAGDPNPSTMDRTQAGIGLEDSERAAQVRRLDPIVGVQEEQPLSPGAGDPRVSSRRFAAVGSLDDPDAGLAPCVPLRDRLCVIGGTIIHHNGFPIGPGLTEERIQCLPDRRRGVIRGDDDRDPRARLGIAPRTPFVTVVH